MTDRIAGDYAIGSQHWPGFSKLIEEMGELQQVLGKIIATNGDTDHWDGTDLQQRLIEELADTWAAIAFFMSINLLPLDQIGERMRDKLATFHKWHQEQLERQA